MEVEMFNKMEDFDEEKIKSLSSKGVEYAGKLLELGVSKDRLRGVIADSFLGNDLSGEDLSVKKVCEELRDWFTENNLSREIGVFWTQLIYDLNVSIGKPYGAQLPPEVVWLMLSLSKNDSKRIYCPYVSSHQLSTASTSFVEEVYLTMKDQPKTKNVIDLFNNLNVQIIDPFKLKEPKTKYDTALCYFFQERHPKLDFEFNGSKFSSSNNTLIGLVHTLRMNPDRVVAIVSQGFLTSTGVAERYFKEYILKKNLLDMVIELPEQTIPGTRLQYSLLVLDRNRNDDQDILMLDSSEGFHEYTNNDSKAPVINWRKLLKELDVNRSRHLLRIPAGDPEEVFDNVDFSPRRHLALQNYLDSDEEFEELGKITHLLRGNPLFDAVEIEDENNVDDSELIFYEASVKDIGVGNVLQRPEKKLLSHRKLSPKQKELILRPNDILMTVKGGIGKLALVPEMGEEKWIPSQSFQVVRAIRRIYDPVVLFYQLLSDEVQEIIATRVTGSTLGQLKIDDLKSLPIPLLEEDKVADIKNKHANLLELRKKIWELEKEYSKEFDLIRGIV